MTSCDGTPNPMRSCRHLGTVIGLVSALSSAAPAQAHSLKDLEDRLLKRETYVQIVNRPAPGFSLKDADNRTVSLADFSGRVVVLIFIYTSCPDVCPLHSEKIAEVQEGVNRTPMRDQVRFIAITTDPERDVPGSMKAYGPAHGLSPVNWLFLTSGAEKPKETRSLARRYGLKFTPSGEGYQMHGVVTHLIDKSGNLRARYHGLKFNVTNMIVHINALTNDDH